MFLDETDLRIAHQSYCDTYDMVRDFGAMIPELQEAEILVQNARVYRFKYPYILYYFVAKYFQENVTQLRALLNEVADHIYNETNANILIFYVYLTKDPQLIGRIINSAKAIYDEYAACDFESHVRFVNDLYVTPPPPLQLTSTDVLSNRDTYNRRRDSALEEADQGSDNETDADQDYKYDRHLQDVVKINIAFKTLSILRQVLRNFTGSLDGSLKLDITREYYALGMRTLSALLSIAEQNIDIMRQYIGQLIADRTGLSDKPLADQTDRAIIWLTIVAAYGTVKRVSYAVGHQDLVTTYQRLLDSDSALSF